MTQSADRQRLMIPRETHEQFRVIAEARGHIMSLLAWCWLREAVKAATEGGRLPSSLSVTTVPPYLGKEIRWTQRSDEYQRWAQVLRTANSSPAAVLRAKIDAYIASGGDAADIGAPLEGLMYA